MRRYATFGVGIADLTAEIWQILISEISHAEDDDAVTYFLTTTTKVANDAAPRADRACNFSSDFNLKKTSTFASGVGWTKIKAKSATPIHTPLFLSTWSSPTVYTMQVLDACAN